MLNVFYHMLFIMDMFEPLFRSSPGNLQDYVESKRTFKMLKKID
jgi:hypothetical protein